jgi:hypothetical protein
MRGCLRRAASNAADQCREVRTPPATAVSNDVIEPATSAFRHASGGF